MDYYLTNYPLMCVALFGGIISCWLFWLFLAFGIYQKNKKQEFSSLPRKLLPFAMIILPIILLGLVMYLNLNTAPPKNDTDNIHIIDSTQKVLCYKNEEGGSVPILDGKYVLYRKFANGNSVDFGIITMLPDLTLRSCSLDIQGKVLDMAQPHDAYSMIAYGVHYLPDFNGKLLQNETSKEEHFNSVILMNPYTGNGKKLSSQAFPFLYIEVLNGKGTVNVGYLSRDNVGDAIEYYGTWLEPIIASYMLNGFSIIT